MEQRPTEGLPSICHEISDDYVSHGSASSYTPRESRYSTFYDDENAADSHLYELLYDSQGSGLNALHHQLAAEAQDGLLIYDQSSGALNAPVSVHAPGSALAVDTQMSIALDDMDEEAGGIIPFVLPIDLLSHVLSYFDLLEVRACARINRSWCTASRLPGVHTTAWASLVQAVPAATAPLSTYFVGCKDHMYHLQQNAVFRGLFVLASQSRLDQPFLLTLQSFCCSFYGSHSQPASYCAELVMFRSAFMRAIKSTSSVGALLHACIAEDSPSPLRPWTLGPNVELSYYPNRKMRDLHASRRRSSSGRYRSHTGRRRSDGSTSIASSSQASIHACTRHGAGRHSVGSCSIGCALIRHASTRVTLDSPPMQAPKRLPVLARAFLCTQLQRLQDHAFDGHRLLHAVSQQPGMTGWAGLAEQLLAHCRIAGGLSAVFEAT